MKYFDTHCHLNGVYFKENKQEAIQRALENTVDKIVLPGTSIKDSLEAIEMAKNNKNLYAAVGIHPADAFEVDCSYLENINPKDIVAIGEVGIDLYRDSNPSLNKQIIVFKKHIEFAIKHNKPILIHMRDAEQEVYDVLKDYKNLKFTMHSFTSTLEWANKFIELGGMISFSGIVTFKNAKDLQEVAKNIPLNKILIETDAPFLSPTPHRGKHNQPSYVKHVGDFISELRNENINEIIYQNSLSFFNL